MKKPPVAHTLDGNGKAPPLNPNWLDRRDHRERSHYGRTPSRRERERERLLRDWFGPERGAMEIMAHQSPCRALGEAVGEVISGLGLGRHVEFCAIADHWVELVGADIAQQARPVALRARRLDVEVSNPSWMYVLRTVHAKQIEQRVKEFTNDRIAAVSFVPEGRHYSSRTNPAERRHGRTPGR